MRTGGQPKAKRSDRQSYVVINNLLRVVRNGFEVRALFSSLLVRRRH